METPPTGSTHDSIVRYSNGTHTIYHGDVGEVLQHTIPPASVDLIICDPPYNIGKHFAGRYDKWESETAYLEWVYPWLDACLRTLKPTGSLYLFASTQAMPFYDLFLRSRITIRSRIVWTYDSSGVQAKRHFGSCYEPILFCVNDPTHYTFNADSIKVEARYGSRSNRIDYRKKEPARYAQERVPSNVWNIPRVRYRMPEYEVHPSQKPEKLLERMILASSNPDDTVLDLFSGTFTTAAVAKRLHRNSISIESQVPYLHIGLRRILEYSQIGDTILTRPHKNFSRVH